MGLETEQEGTGILSSVNRRLLLFGIVAVAVALIIFAGFFIQGQGNDDEIVSAPASVVSSAQATSPALSVERAKARAVSARADPPEGPTIDLGRITTMPISIGHIPLDVQAVLLARLTGALTTAHYASIQGSANAFFDSAIPDNSQLLAIFDHTMLTIYLRKPGEETKEVYQNVSEDMLRISKSFDDLIKLGATPNGDVATEAQYQAALSSFASANGYSLLKGWAPCAPTNDLAVEVVQEDPREQLSSMGFSQEAAKTGGDVSGGLVEAKQISGAYLVYYHRIKS